MEFTAGLMPLETALTQMLSRITPLTAFETLPLVHCFGRILANDVVSPLATLQQALEHVTAAVYEIMIATKNMQEYELQVVAAQDRIAKPEHYFSATQL